MVDPEHDALSPVSPKMMLVTFAFCAAAAAGIFYAVWRDDVNGAVAALKNRPRTVSIANEPGRMMADVRDAVEDAYNDA